MTMHSPMPRWPLACGQRGCLVPRPRHVPENLFLASTYLGFISGLWLGALGSVLFAIVTVYQMGNTDYAVELGGFGIMAGLLIGAVFGTLIGLLNGAVLTVLSRTSVLRGTPGVVRNRLTIAAALTTCVGSLALLYLLLRGYGGLLTYSPVVVGTLLAVPMSRRLRLS